MKTFQLLIAAAVCAASVTTLRADDQTFKQRTFTSPEEATNALVQAAKAHDREAVHQIFGPDITNLMTGDKELDERHFDAFTKNLSEGCSVVNSNGIVTLEIGTNQWPFPIPLVQNNGAWVFDTQAGEDEIINRHIGRDEYYAIGVCRAYVKAQQDYASRFSASGGKPEYARRFKSEEGKTDGLYWESQTNSQFSGIVAEAYWEGYGWNSSKRPKPFHGYYFKILTRQGPDAPGGAKDYIHDGKMTDGFALVAYPLKWGESGVMTFIVGSDGVVRQKSLGEKTLRIASRMKTYNPDKDWTVVDEPGISDLNADDPAPGIREAR